MESVWKLIKMFSWVLWKTPYISNLFKTFLSFEANKPTSYSVQYNYALHLEFIEFFRNWTDMSLNDCKKQRLY